MNDGNFGYIATLLSLGTTFGLRGQQKKERRREERKAAFQELRDQERAERTALTVVPLGIGVGSALFVLVLAGLFRKR